MKTHIIGALVVLAGLSGCAHKPACCGPLLPPPLPLPDAAEQVRAKSPLATVVVDTVHFATDRSDLSDEAKDIIYRQAQWLLRYPETTVVVEGHADHRASATYNDALGMRRARAVKDYLVKAGVDDARVTVVSSGEREPVTGGRDSVSLSLNRRAVTKER
ncbi:OmpA family protein [Sphingomonas sp. 3-13AW]|uniref:OmpA family protein n=1 Tax=Sphingomonas sp. 3-13AW TaxID=3050450 RepID=UPI003BB7C6DC